MNSENSQELTGQERSVNDRLASIERKLEVLLEAQARQDELFEELRPIARAAMDAGIVTFDDLEKRGYFRFGRGLLDTLDRVVTSTGEDELRYLSETVVSLLETARELTQPGVLSVVTEAASVLEERDSLKPVGPLKAVAAARDDEVQQGLAVVLELLRHMGRAADAVSSGRRKRGMSRLAPSRTPRRPRRQQAPAARTDAAASAAGAAPAAETAAAAPAASTGPAPEDDPVLAGVALDSSGFMSDPEQWNEEIARAFARRCGVSELSEEHWKAIRFAREEYLSTGVSPNIRRITKGSGVDTRTLYTLFPKAPGKCVALCAGIPKPAGCI